MTKHQSRRAFILWLPTIALGAVINLASPLISPTFNGASLIALILISAGILALALDNRSMK